MVRNNLKIVKGSKHDFKTIKQLLNLVNLPIEGVKEHVENFLLIFNEDQSHIIGCVGLEVYQKNALLRSLAIHPKKQGLGFGNILTDAIIEFANQLGIKSIFLRTQTAEHFFLKKGFRIVSLNEIPHSVKQSVEFESTVCSESAINMMYSSS